MILQVEDSLVDLYPNSQIYYSVQRIDVGNLQGRSVNYSNTFTAPWTENNARIFGFAFSEYSTSPTIYKLRKCILIEGGVEMARNNVLYITKSTDRNFSLQIFENLVDLFQVINSLSLADVMPFVNSGWNKPDIDAARLNTAGIVTALVMWKPETIYDANFFLPSFYYHSIIKSILEFTGLTATGNILNDPRFTDLVVPFPGEKFEYPESYYSQFAKQVLKGTDQAVSNLINSTVNVVNMSITAPTHGVFFAHVSLGGITWGTGTQLKLRIYKNSAQVAESVMGNSPSPGVIGEVNYTDFVVPGDFIEVRVYSNAMSSPGISFTIVGNSSFLKLSPDGTVDRNLVNWNALLSEISCKSLVTDFFNRFGIVFKQTDTEIILKTIQEIIEDVAATVDWSAKLVDLDKKEINFASSYAQENKMLYSDLVDDPELGVGTISINNETLPVTKTIFSSAFGNTKTVQYIQWNLASILVYNPDATGIEDMSESPGLRLLTLKPQTTEGNITFDATPRNDYKIGYFVDSTLVKDTAFEYFVNQFYPSFQKALQRNKIITKYYNLNEQDIFNYDAHKMVNDGEAYYLVNKIANYKSGRISKVELFKLL